MAQVSGFSSQPSLAGHARLYASVDLDAYREIEWLGVPAEWESWRAPGVSPITPHYPVSTLPTVRAGHLATSYVDDYYNRIHIAPRRLDLGNVVSTQTTQVSVWNAWLEPVTLSAISGTSDGIVISGQDAPPLLYPPLLERAYQVSVAPDGAPVLDVVVGWQFAHGEVPSLRITANRIIAWPFVPDWTEGVVERLTWATDILSSESMAEQRRCLRAAPRREFEASVVAHGAERQYLDMTLFSWSARVWALPVWHDIQQLSVATPAGALSVPCLTAHRDFHAGGLAMLRGHDPSDVFNVEVVEVEAVNSAEIVLKRPTQRDWPAGSRLYPVRSAQLREAPVLSRITDRLTACDVAFRVLGTSDSVSAPPTTLYRGRPVLASRPDESRDLTYEFSRLLSELDSGTATPLLTDVAGTAMMVVRHRWVGGSVAERAAWRALLYWLRGRQRSVWVPTHADDLTVVASAPASAITLDVAHVGYTRFAQGRTGRRDIQIELTDGSVLHRRITGSTVLSDDTERLALDAPHGVDLSPTVVGRISFMAMCRLDSDSVEILHMTDSLAESEVLLRGVRDDEL